MCGDKGHVNPMRREAVGRPSLTGGMVANEPSLPADMELVREPAGLTLRAGGMGLRGDFLRLLPRLRQDRLSRELLVRAARVRGADARPTAVDATAGLGEDALLLAASGFAVTLCERNPVVARLLADALERASALAGLAEVAARMRLVAGDGAAYLQGFGDAGGALAPDVVYLDPMFPQKRKDAATKKKLQLLQMLEDPAHDEEGLLAAALAARPRKVVIKRPLKGPWLGGVKPSYALAGKVVRYDVLVVPRP